MIKFGLRCDADHRFEGWFGSSDEFATQAKRGFVSCPVCGSAKVEKALMAPSVSTSRTQDAVRSEVMNAHAQMLGQMRKLRDAVTKDAENVGPRFAEEARRIHYGETEPKAVYGQATKEEVASLVEEGVTVAPLPVLPEDTN